MDEFMRQRCVESAQYVIKHNATIRQAAKAFGVSKSTIHKDVVERLGRVNVELSNQVKNILAHNKATRHIRGGLATKKKHMEKNSK